MKWYDGSIPSAIQLAKSKGSLFVVYIYGDDEMSQEMDKSWDSEVVTAPLDNLVAIRIQNTSEECKHFSQIYPVVVVPATFCIGENGVPLEVIGGPLKPDQLVTKIQNVRQMHAAQKQSLQRPSVDTQGASGNTASLPTSSEVQLETAEASTVPLEEKVEKAKELLEKKRNEKAKTEFENVREEEVKRRKLGQDLQKLKHNQQETQMKEIKDQMRKDKEEEKKAKDRIRQQIARDREERQARYEKDKREREQAADDKKRDKLLQQQALAAAQQASKSDTARIQVRLPDGSSLTQQFPSTDPLRSLHTFVTERLGGNVVLSQAYPKRRFTDDDMSSSFADLELAPSAVIIAMPSGHTINQASSVQSPGIFSLILSPFMTIWNFVYALIFGGGRSSPPGTADTNTPVRADTSQNAQDTSSQSNPSRNRPTTAYQRRSGTSQGGNMRRLADMKDDDEDMSTYNGNSTQQL